MLTKQVVPNFNYTFFERQLYIEISHDLDKDDTAWTRVSFPAYISSYLCEGHIDTKLYI